MTRDPSDADWEAFEADQDARIVALEDASLDNDPDARLDRPSAREIARSARGEDVAVVIEPGSPDDAFWCAVRAGVLSGRRLMPALLQALLAARRVALQAAYALDRLRLRVYRTRRRGLIVGAAPPGAVVASTRT